MRVLQICNKPPFPPKDGGCLAMRNISCGLITNEIDLSILTIETDKHPFDKEEDIPERYQGLLKIESVYVDTSLNLVDAFSNLITSDSYNVSRFFTPDMDIHLTNILKKQKFDVIHLESLFVTPYIATIRRLSKAKIVLRSHNLEYMIWERLAKKSGNPAKKIYLNVLAKQLKKYELNTLKHVDGIVSISSEDGDKYKKVNPEAKIINIPFGIDLEEYEPGKELKNNVFFHLGSLSWKPNLEGVLWFLKNIWPTFYDKNPDTTFLLAGREIPQSITEMNVPGVEIVGEVDNAKEFILNSGTMVVPLRAAGGIRVKIIEGMALGVPVISTTVGAEGINCKDNHNILIANEKKDFIKKMEACLDSSFQKRIGNQARQLIVQEHDNQLLTQRLIWFYNELLAQ